MVINMINEIAFFIVNFSENESKYQIIQVHANRLKTMFSGKSFEVQKYFGKNKFRK